MRKSVLSFFLLLLALTASTQTYISSVQAFDSPGYDSTKTTRKNGWIKPAIAIGYIGATYLCYHYLDTRVQKQSQKWRTNFTNSVSEVVTAPGLGKVQAIGWGATAIYAFTAKNKKLQKTVIIWAGALLINSVVTDQLKLTFQRHRPNTGDPYNTFDWRKGPGINTSLPSAHTSNAFTTATVFATLYKNVKWVPPVAYGLASLVGLTRIYNNMHWASDVMAGAAIGFVSAKASNALYNWFSKKISFLPQISSGHCSIELVYQF